MKAVRDSSRHIQSRCLRDVDRYGSRRPEPRDTDRCDRYVVTGTRLPTIDDRPRTDGSTSPSGHPVAGASGFTLVEFLVTIRILGVLSGVVILAVGGLQSKSQSSACAQ